MKTIRFATIVTRAGKPEHYLMWKDPGRDAILKRAVHENRLLTVHQQTRGSKKDFGQVGFEVDRDAQYFVFPRSLRAFIGARVVAIDYELANERLALATPAPGKKPRQRSRGNLIAFPASEGEPTRASLDSEVKQIAPPSMAEIRKALTTVLREMRAGKAAAATKRLTELVRTMRD